MLRELALVLVRPVLSTFERSLQLEEVPEDWKNANAIPIFKKNTKEDSEYRLIILASIPGSTGYGDLHKHQLVWGGHYWYAQGLRLSPLLLTNFIKGIDVVGQECNIRNLQI